jgi:hypothetical protein
LSTLLVCIACLHFLSALLVYIACLHCLSVLLVVYIACLLVCAIYHHTILYLNSLIVPPPSCFCSLH